MSVTELIILLRREREMKHQFPENLTRPIVRTMKLNSSCALLLALFVSASQGQNQTPGSSTPAKTDSSKVEPLKWMLGNWTGSRFEPSSGDRAPVLSKVSNILGGAAEQEELEIKTPKGVYRGLYIHAMDPRIGKSVLIYINARRREFVRLEGTASSSGGEWQGVSVEGPRRAKLMYEVHSKDRWRRTQYVSTDSGATWEILFVDDLSRKEEN